MLNFVVIVDGEVAINFPIRDVSEVDEASKARQEMLIAALSSNPTLMMTPHVQPGSKWDGKAFTPPSEQCVNMTSPWQEWKKKNAERQQYGVVRPWDVLNPDTEYASESAHQQRLAICEGCEHYMATQQCTKCGCFMPVKTKLKYAVCPVGKWGIAHDNETTTGT